MRAIIFSIIIFFISKFAFCQKCTGLDTLSLEDFYSNDIVILGSKNELFLKLGNPSKTDRRYIICFQEVENNDTLLFVPERINFISYMYDKIGLQYVDINDKVMLRMINFNKGSIAIIHPNLTFISKLKLEDFLKAFSNFDISEEFAINYFKTKNKRKKVHVIRFCTGNSTCIGQLTEVIFDSRKYLRIIYFSNYYW
jgi:hypothetical protein